MCVCTHVCTGACAHPPSSPGAGSVSHRGVLAQLAERGEGFLVRFPDLLSEIVQLCCHFIALCAFLLRRLLLFLVPVIPDGWKRETRHIRGHCGWARMPELGGSVSPHLGFLGHSEQEQREKVLQTHLTRKEARGWEAGRARGLSV